MKSTLLGIIGGLLLFSVADAAEIRFNKNAQCSDTIVVLADLAEIIPEKGETDEIVLQLGKTKLFPAPISGGTRIVNAAQIRDVLSNQGISSLDHRYTGSNQITIQGPGNVQRQKNQEDRELKQELKSSKKVEEELQSALITYLNRATTDGKVENAIPWEITLRLSPEQIRTLSEGGKILGIYGGKNPLIGTQEFQTELEGMNVKTGRRMLVRFSAEIALPPHVVVAKRNLSKNKILNENDLQRVYRKDLKGTDYYSDFNEVIGKAVSNNIREGTVISGNMIQSPIMIKKGEVVTVYAKAPGVVVRSLAKALEDGAMGDLITVEQLQKAKPEKGRIESRDRTDSSFLALVTGIGTADVYATADSMTN
ncbi:MAG: flagellar basal body P-ring formation chaperone FlgA [Thermoguttaceae bacterium]